MKFRQNEEGISLIEVVASIVLLSIILISFSSLLPQMGKTNNHNENKQQAVNLAQKELVDWKNELEHYGEFNIFLTNPVDPSTYDDFISKVNNIRCKDTQDCTSVTPTDIDIISITTDSLDPKYKVMVLLETNPHLQNGATKAYQTTVTIFNNKSENISETYGYILR